MELLFSLQPLQPEFEKTVINAVYITLHENPSGRYDSNYWLNTVLLDGNLHMRGEEDAYRETVKLTAGWTTISSFTMRRSSIPSWDRRAFTAIIPPSDPWT